MLGLMLVAIGTSCGSSKSTSPPAATTTNLAPTTTAAPTVTTPAPTATTPAPTTTIPTKKLTPAAKLILELAKAPAKSSLPPSLEGSTTQATPLAAGSRKHHAAGAMVTTNGGALVGYLIFKSRRDALADLKAYPPNSGPNAVIETNPAGFPEPSYVLKAVGNGYIVRYVVFVDGPVIVNAWAYGQKGKKREAQLVALVKKNARWGLARLTTAQQAIK
jgi:hypothetical protein